MKRLFIIFAAVILVVSAGCADENSGPSLKMDSNIDAISGSGSRSIVYGEPIIRDGKGVMVIFRDRGQIPFEVPDDTFYLYYAGDGETVENGDGTEFNYILRCPSALAEAHDEAYDSGEAAYQSGDAFWVYISTYIDKDITFENRDFNIILPLLLEYKGEKLPYPDAEDYPAEN